VCVAMAESGRNGDVRQVGFETKINAGRGYTPRNRLKEYNSLDTPLKHCGACFHPTHGKPMRAATGSEKAVVG
jgi:hypothetical protein